MDVLIKSSSGRQSAAQTEVRTLGGDERRRAALKALGLCWGISLLTLPLPPLHWVTVPFFFFFGIYLAWKKWRQTSYFTPFSFPCPECGKEVMVKEQPVESLQEVVCPHCRFGLKVETPALG